MKILAAKLLLVTAQAVCSLVNSYEPVAMNPAGTFAYAIDPCNNMVAAYKVDPNGGTWTPSPQGLMYSTGATPVSVAVESSGRYLYVASMGDGNNPTSISAYLIAQSSGGLMARPQSVAFPASSRLSAMAIDPTGRFVYATDYLGNGVYALRIDKHSGGLSLIGNGNQVPTGRAPSAAKIDASGRFLYVRNAGETPNTISAFSIDPATGALSPVAGSPFKAGNGYAGLAMDAYGDFLFAGNSADKTISAFRINPQTGALAPLPKSPMSVSTAPKSLSVDFSGKYLEVVSSGSGGISTYLITSSGSLTLVGSTTLPATSSPASGAGLASNGSVKLQ